MVHRVQRTIAGKTLTLESGLLAGQAHGAVTLRLGDTVLLTTVVMSSPRAGIDFFPLTVEFEERFYAAGKIPGSFFKREGRPSTEATLAARLTDRPIRPLFPKGFRNEVQVISTVLSADRVHPAGHPLHRRRVRGPHPLPHPLPGPHQRVPGGLRGR